MLLKNSQKDILKRILEIQKLLKTANIHFYNVQLFIIKNHKLSYVLWFKFSLLFDFMIRHKKDFIGIQKKSKINSKLSSFCTIATS